MVSIAPDRITRTDEFGPRGGGQAGLLVRTAPADFEPGRGVECAREEHRAASALQGRVPHVRTHLAHDLGRVAVLQLAL